MCLPIIIDFCMFIIVWCRHVLFQRRAKYPQPETLLTPKLFTCRNEIASTRYSVVSYKTLIFFRTGNHDFFNHLNCQLRLRHDIVECSQLLSTVRQYNFLEFLRRLLSPNSVLRYRSVQYFRFCLWRSLPNGRVWYASRVYKGYEWRIRQIWWRRLDKRRRRSECELIFDDLCDFCL
jgi:hypothetical protein